MSDRTRVKFVVEVDLDPTYGAMHTPEGAREIVQGLLDGNMGHYRPTVEFAREPKVTMFSGQQGTVAVGDLIIVHGSIHVIEQIEVFEPHGHDGANILPYLYALKVTTSVGERWRGVTSLSRDDDGTWAWSFNFADAQAMAALPLPA